MVQSSKLVFLGGVADQEYDLDELLRSEAEVLGKGTFGVSYKAYLEDHKITVNVKRLKIHSLPENEFKEKVEQLGRIIHPNLLPLKAYYYDKSERLLVFDYMSRGSLAFVLHGIGGVKGSQVTWEAKCGIIYGVCQGIRYLHDQGPNVCHGNIRSSNVLLTSANNACLSDYGISQLFIAQPATTTTLVAGYCAPEVKSTNKISQKSDVYSFGVLLLELVTGKAPAGAITQLAGIEDLPKWTRTMLQEKPILDVIDAPFNDPNMGSQVSELLQLAICCTFQNPSKRPSIAAVTNQIRETCKFPVEATTETNTSRQFQFSNLEGF